MSCGINVYLTGVLILYGDSDVYWLDKNLVKVNVSSFLHGETLSKSETTKGTLLWHLLPTALKYWNGFSLVMFALKLATLHLDSSLLIP